MDTRERLFELLVARSGFRCRDRVEDYCRGVLGDLDLAGRAVLEIGCGKGWISLYAASSGASRVVGLEPETEGSTSGDLAEFRAVIRLLNLTPVVEARAETIQHYDPREARFDLVVSRASINHLDEEACIHLRTSPEARESYRAIFAKIAGLLRPGGHLVITDSSPRNVFPLLGLRNPIAPTIEWDKHQPPREWAGLLSECGFRDPQISWRMPRPLAPFGRLAANELVSFFLWSRFRLVMRRA